MRSADFKSFFLLCISLYFLSLSSISFAKDWRYKVKPGDNIWNITERYLSGMHYWKRLQALNSIQDPYHIPPGTVLNIPIKWLNQAPMVARIHALVGSVKITDNFSAKIRPIRVGEYIFIDDTLITEEDSTATVEFVDGSTLLLEPNSRLKFDHVGVYPGTGMTDTRLKLEDGRIETDVAPRKGEATRFEISTPAGVTSVRGTDYRVSSESLHRESRTEVIEGKVAVTSSRRSRLVPAGFGTVSSASIAPMPPVKLLEAPQPVAPMDVFDRLPMHLQINTLDGADRFRLQVAASTEFDRVLFDKLFQERALRIEDLPDGDYFARIRGIDSNGLEGLHTEIVFTLNARPEAPFLVEPEADGAVVDENPLFKWAQLKSVETYYFQLAADAGFNQLLMEDRELTENQIVSTVKLDLGQYYWRVASQNAEEGLGPFGDIQSFRRVLPAPQTEEPEISDSELTIRWRKGLAGQNYQVQMDVENSFANPFIDQVVDTPKLTITRPESGDYFVRVRTIETDGFIGPYGEAQLISVPSEFSYWWFLSLLLLGLIAI